MVEFTLVSQKILKEEIIDITGQLREFILSLRENLEYDDSCRYYEIDIQDVLESIENNINLEKEITELRHKHGPNFKVLVKGID
jgi:hypothetical protein